MYFSFLCKTYAVLNFTTYKQNKKQYCEFTFISLNFPGDSQKIANTSSIVARYFVISNNVANG